MHPLTVSIITRDSVEQREVRQQYILETRFPRWQMLKILLHAIFTMKFR